MWGGKGQKSLQWVLVSSLPGSVTSAWSSLSAMVEFTSVMWWVGAPNVHFNIREKGKIKIQNCQEAHPWHEGAWHSTAALPLPFSMASLPLSNVATQ